MTIFSIIWGIDAGIVTYFIPLFLVLLGLELYVEMKHETKSYRLNDALTNIGCGVTQQITNLFLKLIGVGMYDYIYRHYSLTDIPVTWLTVLVLFLLTDLCYYWAHRKSHEINILWTGHVVHHQSEDFNLTVALRQGATQTLFNSLFYLPLAFMGFNPYVYVTVSAVVNLYQFWIHTEAIGHLGWFEKWFNTPSHHRVHHGRDLKYIDKNYGGVFILWDKMFGTFQQEEDRPSYGVTVPVNSWNPVWVNVKYLTELARGVWQAPGFRNKFRIVFNPPGWFPESMGGYQAPPEVDKKRYRKFDKKADSSINLYILFQFIITLIGVAVLMFQGATLSTPIKGLMSGLVLLSMINYGMLFESHRAAVSLEIIRLTLNALVTLYLARHHHDFIQVAAIVYLPLSLTWLLSPPGMNPHIKLAFHKIYNKLHHRH